MKLLNPLFTSPGPIDIHIGNSHSKGGIMLQGLGQVMAHGNTTEANLADPDPVTGCVFPQDVGGDDGGNYDGSGGCG